MKKNGAHKIDKIFRVNNKRNNNPQDSQQIKNIYLNHTINSKDIVSKLPQKREYFSVLGIKSQKQSKKQKGKQVASATIRNVNSVLLPSKDTKKICRQDTINQQSLRTRQCQSTCQKGNQSRTKNRKQVVHLSYLQYEQLMQQNTLKPTYFEDLGKKNDEKYQDVINYRKKTRDLLQTSNTQLVPVRLNKNIKYTKTEISQKKTDISAKTIIGCAIGALSTYQIKQKLQQKWQEEQRIKRMKNNNYIFTEQSEGSQGDKKQYTQTTFQEATFFGKTNKKRKNLDVLNERKKVDWDKIPNENYKKILKKILQIRKNTLNTLTEPEFSKGQQYQIRQELMNTVMEVYNPKRFVMQHKLQWRV